ncbi:MAG: hypothetical protein ACQETV_01680 [Actinomycetota bacterium]
MVIVAGCGSQEEATGRQGGEEPGGHGGTVAGDADGDDPALACERDGYACTWAEADAEAVGEALALGRQLDALAQEGFEAEAIAEALADRDDVVDARVGPTAAWFRLEGARPVWVLGDEALVAEEQRQARAAPSAVPAVDIDGSVGGGGDVVVRPASLASDPAPRAVVGQDHAAKSALVLSAYEWDGLAWAAEEVARLLEGTRGYEGGVTHLANTARGDQTVGPTQFLGWDAYDVVYGATHGSQLCDGSACQTILGLGIPGVRVDEADDPEALAMLEEAGYADTPGVGIAFERGHAVVAIEGDWLAATYAGELDDTLVFVQACSSARAADLTGGLLGEDSAFLGWSDTALASDAGPAAERLFGELVERGVTSGEAYAGLEAEGLHRSQGGWQTEGEFLPGDTVYRWEDGELRRLEPEPGTREIDAVLEHHVGGADVRVREVVELEHPDTGAPLEGRPRLPLGTNEDGEPTLPVRVAVDGVLPGQEADFELSLVVNGIGLPERWTLADAEAEQVDDEAYVATDDVVLTADLGGGLEIVAELDGAFPLERDPDDGVLVADPPADWATYTYRDSLCPEGSGVLPTTSEVAVPRAGVDLDGAAAEVDLRFVEQRGGPALDCGPEGATADGARWSEHEAFVTAYVLGDNPGAVALGGDVPRQLLDVVGPDTVRFADWQPGTGDVLLEHVVADSYQEGGITVRARAELQLRAPSGAGG